MKSITPLRAKPSVLTGWLFSVLHWPSPETTEWFCLRSALWWVIAPCLHLFAVNGAFSGLAHFGPEGQWQVVLGAMLVLQITGACIGRVWLRVGTLVCFSALWAFFAGMFWADSPHIHGLPRSTGVGIYLSLAADCMIVATHLVKLWYIDHRTRRKQQTGWDKNKGESPCPSLSS